MKNGKERIPNEKEFLVTPEEAINVVQFVGMDSMCFAANLEEMFLTAKKDESEAHWKHLLLLTAIFEAGRIQGIREQRKARKANAV